MIWVLAVYLFWGSGADGLFERHEADQYRDRALCERDREKSVARLRGSPGRYVVRCEQVSVRGLGTRP